MTYKKVWRSFHGDIPKDGLGRSYEIHHIDGNRKNNSIENLKCVSIEEHFNIHLTQGDYEAAALIGSRLGLTEEELLLLRLKGVPKPTLKCPHCGKVGGKPQMLQWHFDNCSVVNSRPKKPKYKCSKCGNEVGGKNNLIQHERSCGISKSLKRNTSLTCPHCGFVGKAHSNMERWHFDNCTTLTKLKRTHTEQHIRNLRKPKKKK